MKGRKGARCLLINQSVKPGPAQSDLRFPFLCILPFEKKPKLASGFLTDNALRSVFKNANFTEANFGKALERAVAKRTASRFDHLSRPGFASADFLSKITGKHYDLIVDSVRSIREHLLRP